MSNSAIAPVIAGLAVGIAFISIFTLFGLHIDGADTRGLKVTLQRSAGDCFSPGCLYYRVQVNETGIVYFEGSDWTRDLGSHYSRISEQDMHELVNEIKKADFFNFDESYGEPPIAVAGLNSTVISVMLDGKSKTVMIFGGQTIPPEVNTLAERIDEILGTDKWTSAAND